MLTKYVQMIDDEESEQRSLDTKSMDLVAAIEKRHSIIRYERRSVPKETIQQMVAKGRNAAPLYPDIHVHWYIVWNGSVLSRRLDGLSGTNGRTVRGTFTTAPHYIIAVSQVRPGYGEHVRMNLGFRMGPLGNGTQLTLSATMLGLGTCWVGDMLSEQGAHSGERVRANVFACSLEEKLHDFIPDLGTNERIVALTPLGYADTSRAAQMARQLIRWSTNRRGRHKPLQEIVFQDIWGVPWVSDNEILQRLLRTCSPELTCLAPSLANTQPWHGEHVRNRRRTTDQRPGRGHSQSFSPGAGRTCSQVTGSSVHRRTCSQGKPYHRLDGGIAMCHLYCEHVRLLPRQQDGRANGIHYGERVRKQLGDPGRANTFHVRWNKYASGTPSPLTMTLRRTCSQASGNPRTYFVRNHLNNWRTCSPDS